MNIKKAKCGTIKPQDDLNRCKITLLKPNMALKKVNITYESYDNTGKDKQNIMEFKDDLKQAK